MTKVNYDELAGGLVGSAVSFTGVTIADVDHWVSIACGVIGIAITIITTVVIPFIKRVKKAKEDGKVTIDEVDDILKETSEDMDKLKGKK